MNSMESDIFTFVMILLIVILLYWIYLDNSEKVERKATQAYVSFKGHISNEDKNINTIFMKRNDINHINLLGSILLILSAFLPWIKIPFLGEFSLLDIQRNLDILNKIGSNRIDNSLSLNLNIVVMLVFISILISGIISLSKPGIGGGWIAIIALVLSTITAYNLDYVKYFYTGYYLAWVGTIITLIVKSEQF